MSADCFYCTKDQKLNDLMIEIGQMEVSTLYLFREQTYRGRCIVAYNGHVKELFELPEKELAKKMSIVFTERITPELMTVADVVAMGRYPYTGGLGILTPKDEAVVAQCMEQIRISPLKERNFMSLSDGQKQRVLLAKALCQEPEILILDEPTSYLDVKYKLEFLSMLQEMTRKSRPRAA